MIADLQRPVAWATIRQRVCQEEIKIVAHKSGKSERVDKIVQALQPLAIPISDLTPDAANARKHNTRNLDAIAASLRQFGQRKPIVAQRVNDALIVRAGNGTREAAISLGWTHIAAVVIEEDSTSATAYALADNRTAELAEWDNEVLASLLTTFDDDTRELAGWSDGEAEELLKKYDVDSIDAPRLADGDREPYQQMTFTLSDEQAECIKQAMASAKKQGGDKSDQNENSNGNALAFICARFLNG